MITEYWIPYYTILNTSESRLKLAWPNQATFPPLKGQPPSWQSRDFPPPILPSFLCFSPSFSLCVSLLLSPSFPLSLHIVTLSPNSLFLDPSLCGWSILSHFLSLALVYPYSYSALSHAVQYIHSILAPTGWSCSFTPIYALIISSSFIHWCISTQLLDVAKPPELVLRTPLSTHLNSFRYAVPHLGPAGSGCCTGSGHRYPQHRWF